MARSKTKPQKNPKTKQTPSQVVGQATASQLSWWRKWFAIDLRSLAALRVVLGFLILADLIYRWPTLRAMYSDSGFFSRETRSSWLESLPTVTQFGWSLHCISGEAWWQIALFGVAAILAVMMVAGYRSRIAIVGSWALLASLHSRNPIITSSGDTYLRVVLFWSMFLPLAEVWSLDSWLRKKRTRQGSVVPSLVLIEAAKRDGRFSSGATFGLISALFVLYFFPGIAKWNEIWLSGDAMEYVLRLDIYATEFGRGMLDRPELLKWITWVTLAAEIVLPMALVLLWPFASIRYFVLVCFVTLHAGIALCMDIGLFPYICSGIWVFVLPGSFWERVGLKLPLLESTDKSDERADRFYVRLGSVLCFGLAIYFLCWNVAHFDNPACKALMPEQARGLTKALNMRQGFMMFDRPGNQSPWFVYEARLANGNSIDVLRNALPDHGRPESVRATMPSMQWRRVHRNLVRQRYKMLREPVAHYVMRNWNESHDEQHQIEMLKVTFHSEETVPREEPVGEMAEVWFQFGRVSVLEEMRDKFNRGGSWLPD